MKFGLLFIPEGSFIVVKASYVQIQSSIIFVPYMDSVYIFKLNLNVHETMSLASSNTPDVFHLICKEIEITYVHCPLNLSPTLAWSHHSSNIGSFLFLRQDKLLPNPRFRNFYLVFPPHGGHFPQISTRLTVSLYSGF